jgi:AbrB family looped-hinge helix DNA binding protein
MSVATLSSKFQISVPKDIREALQLKPGQKLVFLNTGTSIKLVPQPAVAELFGIAQGADTSHYRDRNEVQDLHDQALGAVLAAKQP